MANCASVILFFKHEDNNSRLFCLSYWFSDHKLSLPISQPEQFCHDVTPVCDNISRVWIAAVCPFQESSHTWSNLAIIEAVSTENATLILEVALHSQKDQRKVCLTEFHLPWLHCHWISSLFMQVWRVLCHRVVTRAHSQTLSLVLRNIQLILFLHPQDLQTMVCQPVHHTKTIIHLINTTATVRLHPATLTTPSPSHTVRLSFLTSFCYSLVW